MRHLPSSALLLIFCQSTTTLFLLRSPYVARSFVLRPAVESLHHRSIHRLFSSSAIDTDPDELRRWEDMYAAGAAEEGSETDARATAHYPVRVVSFDLDNTLWKTSPTIAAANDALAVFVEEHTTETSIRVETIMGDLFRANKTRYCPLLEDSAQKVGPVRLTELRKDALRTIFEEDEKLVEQGFNLWCDTRHSVIRQQYSAVDVVTALQRLRATCPGVVIGAITDGNSDPTAVWKDEIQWDFVVKAEDVGVGKPDARVYEHAIAQVEQKLQANGGVTPPPYDESRGRPWWVHVGDDFVKDIVAAKTMGMRSIWARELILEQLEKKRAEQQAAAAPPRAYETFLQETAGQEVIQMKALGADEYLADGLEQDFADATVDTFVDVVDTIVRWHTASQEEESISDTAQGAPPVSVLSGQEPKEEVSSTRLPTTAKATKFCIHCGEQLPQQARFCSSCGEKLEV